MALLVLSPEVIPDRPANYTNEADGTASYVTELNDGRFSVAFYDIDARAFLPIVKIFPADAAAKADAFAATVLN